MNQNSGSVRDSGTPAQGHSGSTRLSAPPRVPHEQEGSSQRSELTLPQSRTALDLALALEKISSLEQSLALVPMITDLEKNRLALVSVNERVMDEIANSRSEISHLNTELSTAAAKNARLVELKDNHEQEISRVREELAANQRSFANLKEKYSSIGEAFADLKKRYDEHSAYLREMKKEVEATRKDAAAGISAVHLAFQPSNIMAKSLETKESLAELQTALSESQQVTDMLRNKLHIQASQLADTQERVRSLEDENRHLRQDLDSKPLMEHLVKVEKEIVVTSGHLKKCAEESINTAVDLASVQVQLEDRERQIIALKDTLQRVQTERDQLKAEGEARLLTIKELSTQLSLLEESKEDTKALVTELKKRLDEKEHAVQDKEENLEGLMVDKADLQEQLATANNAATKYLCSIESLKDALSGVQEKNAALEERLEVQSVALFKAKEENSLLKSTEMSKTARVQEQLAATVANRDALVNALEGRYASAERASGADRRALADAEGRVNELSSANERLKLEIQSMREAQRIGALSHSNKTDERLLEFQRRNEILLKERDELHCRSQNMLERYQTNKLSNEEKVFVERIIQDGRAIHEDEMVKKGHEIRLRDVLIQELRAKNQELESTLARYIKEAKQTSDANNRSVVGLKAWLPKRPLILRFIQPMFPAGEETFVEQEARASGSKKRAGHIKQDHEDDNIETSSLSSVASYEMSSTGKKRVRSPTPFADPPAKAKKRAPKGNSPIPAGGSVTSGKVNKATGHSANLNSNRLPHSASPPDAAPKKKATGRRRK
ncbi:hypothetical protein BJ165DRAFT_1409419 [Panaeolus papilionaceus]|nr:hypothetical protein BJ165DRAFT_1409419 [Panaeolus papilionaceus]